MGPLEEIAERMSKAAARWPWPNRQELAHMRIALARLPSRECFAVLAEPFSRAAPEAGDVQEYAGRLLLYVKPAFPLDDVAQALRRLLSNWDVSVEQMPWYVQSVVDADLLQSMLDQIEEESETMKQQVERFRFWCRVPVEQRADR